MEWAAKAAGIEFGVIHQRPHRRCQEGWTPWNPLVDDGDALRLAVKLGIVCSAGLHQKYVHDNDTMQAWALFDDRIYEAEEWSRQSGDPAAATRRCIVRAAASIGQQKGE